MWSDVIIYKPIVLTKGESIMTRKEIKNEISELKKVMKIVRESSL
jgi:hypothetical protein